MRLFFVALASMVLASPAFATAHNASHATNWLEQLVFFGPILSLVIVGLIARSRAALATAAGTVIVPVLWAMYRVWSMDGPWNVAHLAKHHAELGYTAAAVAVLAIVLVVVRRPRIA